MLLSAYVRDARKPRTLRPFERHINVIILDSKVRRPCIAYLYPDMDGPENAILEPDTK